jgi:hypothetical protein
LIKLEINVRIYFIKINLMNNLIDL